MTELYKSLTPPPQRYFDRKFPGTRDEYFRKLDESTTLYIGNLSFYTSEEQIYELFSMVGDVKRIIMGLDREHKTPCGFCFVEYYERSAGEAAMRYLNGTMLDERLVRTDWDPGFTMERQYGRGASGGQVRDEYRPDYDAGRGGYGRQYQQREAPEAYTEFQQAPTQAAGTKRARDDEEGAATSAVGGAPPPPSQFTAEADGLGHDAKRNPRFREHDDEASE